MRHFNPKPGTAKSAETLHQLMCDVFKEVGLDPQQDLHGSTSDAGPEVRKFGTQLLDRDAYSPLPKPVSP